MHPPPFPVIALHPPGLPVLPDGDDGVPPPVAAPLPPPLQRGAVRHLTGTVIVVGRGEGAHGGRHGHPEKAALEIMNSFSSNICPC